MSAVNDIPVNSGASSLASNANDLSQHTQANLVNSVSVSPRQQQQQQRINTNVQNLRDFAASYMQAASAADIMADKDALKRLLEVFASIKYLIRRCRDQSHLLLDEMSGPRLVQLFVELIGHCARGLCDLLDVKRPAQFTDEDLVPYHFIGSLCQLVWCLSNFSARFRRVFHAREGTIALLGLLSNEQLLAHFLLFRKKRFQPLDENCALVKALVGTLHNLSKTLHFDDQLNATGTLLSVAHHMRAENAYLMPIYLTLANIMTDREIDSLPDTAEIVQKLTAIIGECAAMIEEGARRRRRKKPQDAADCDQVDLNSSKDDDAQYFSDSTNQQSENANADCEKTAYVDFADREDEQAHDDQGKHVPRIKVELETDGRIGANAVYVCVATDDNGIQWDLIELINGLYRIAVNDSIKNYIYVECDVGAPLDKIVSCGNATEKEYAIRLLYQLAFDKSVARRVAADRRRMAALRRLIRLHESSPEHFKLVEYCRGVLWIVDKWSRRNSCTTYQDDTFAAASTISEISADRKERSNGGRADSPYMMSRTLRDSMFEYAKHYESVLPQSTASSLTPTPSTTSLEINKQEAADSSDVRESFNITSANQIVDNNQIMISYNTFSREVCLKIKSELEKVGYKIWIDTENICGSALDSMAQAIETSGCILICMTEKYKLSTNCRAEAEYCFSLRKRFIPLIMQTNYKPDGWLGIMLGSKIFINFARFTFDDSIEKLKKEIQKVMALKTIPSNLDPPAILREMSLNPSTDTATVTLQEELIFPISEPNGNRRCNNSVPECAVENCQENQIHEWTVQMVFEWMQQSQLSANIICCLEEFDGTMLEELNAMRRAAPEYFYATMHQNKTTKLADVIKFSIALQKLCGK